MLNMNPYKSWYRECLWALFICAAITGCGEMSSRGTKSKNGAPSLMAALLDERSSSENVYRVDITMGRKKFTLEHEKVNALRSYIRNSVGKDYPSTGSTGSYSGLLEINDSKFVGQLQSVFDRAGRRIPFLFSMDIDDPSGTLDGGILMELNTEVLEKIVKGAADSSEEE